MLLAIGPFSQAVVESLDYPARYYDDVPEGATVITMVFESFSTSGSREVARCFGVGAWDLGHHALGNAPTVDIAGLRAEQDSADHVDHFLALREAGFQFYYMPNG